MRKAVTLTCEKGFGELIMFEWLQCMELFFMKKARKCAFFIILLLRTSFFH